MLCLLNSNKPLPVGYHAWATSREHWIVSLYMAAFLRLTLSYTRNVFSYCFWISVLQMWMFEVSEMSSSWHLSIPSALKTVAHFVSSNVWIMQNNQYYKIERITTFYTYIGGHWNTGCKNLPLSLLMKYIVIDDHLRIWLI